jgi:hypothetical protein
LTRTVGENDAPQAHWFFKSEAKGVTSLCVLVLADGDFWVVDSPTGTYLSGHAERGKWRAAAAQYLAEGYVAESQAREQGLISASWSRPAPDPASLRPRAITHTTVILVLIIVALVVLIRFVPWLLSGTLRW